jgi:antitoxin ParD1/3/4
MNANSLTVMLPKPLRTFVEEQAAEKGFRSPGAYLQSLVRAAKKRRAEEMLHALLLEGLKSGEPIEVTPEYWKAKQRRLNQRGRKVKTA